MGGVVMDLVPQLQRLGMKYVTLQLQEQVGGGGGGGGGGGERARRDAKEV